MLFAISCKYSSSQVNYCKILTLHRERQGFEKIREHMVDGPSIVFTRKTFVERLLIGIRQTGAKPISEMMLASLFFCLCVKQWQLVCTEDGSQVRNPANLHRVKTRRGVLKTWSSHTFRESDHSDIWKVSTRRLHRKKLMHTLLMAFVDTATICLKPWDANIIHVKKLVFLSLRKKFGEA